MVSGKVGYLSISVGDTFWLNRSDAEHHAQPQGAGRVG